jgi:hypothetical protein
MINLKRLKLLPVLLTANMAVLVGFGALYIWNSGTRNRERAELNQIGGRSFAESKIMSANEYVNLRSISQRLRVTRIVLDSDVDSAISAFSKFSGADSEKFVALSMAVCEPFVHVVVTNEKQRDKLQRLAESIAKDPRRDSKGMALRVSLQLSTSLKHKDSRSLIAWIKANGDSRTVNLADQALAKL